MKRILSVQDISCIGKCSLTVALPVISAMGVECAVIPTAVLSTHTAFDGFTFRDLTSDIKPITVHWKKEGFTFDAIYTGYLGSFEQLRLVSDIIDQFPSKVCIDPVMGDNGKLYPGFTPEFAFEMAKLCGRADVILPNMTEACLLVNQNYDFLVQTNESITKVMAKLLSLGAKQVILKGVEFSKEKIGVAYCSQKLFDNNFSTNENNMEDMNIYFHHRYDENFHGTGVFASAVTGALVLKKDIKDAVKIACDFVQESIECTLSNPNYNWYGVDFESALRNLPQKL